jgi:hypothetical protein
MASLMKSMKKFLMDNLVLIIALLIGVVGVGVYSFNKVPKMDSMAVEGEGDKSKDVVEAPLVSVAPAKPMGQNSDYLRVQGLASAAAKGLPPVNKNINTPSDLIPSDPNSEWASQNPVGAGSLKDVSLITPQQQIGVSGVGSCNRNANLQVRPDPCIPKMNTGPFNQSTIEGCQQQRSFDLGGATVCAK